MGGGDERYDLGDTMHHVMVSAGIDDVDPDDIYGDGRATSPDASGRHRSRSGFSCVVTLDDGQELSGDVLSFQRARSSRSVRFVTSLRAADDICTRDVVNVAVLAASGVAAFDVAFDPVADDQPDVAFERIDDGVTIALSFGVGDSYRAGGGDGDDT